MDRQHFRWDDGALGTLIEGPTFWEAWLRRPNGKKYALRVLSDPWNLDKAAEIARAALEATQRVEVQMAGGADVEGVRVPAGVPLLMEHSAPGATVYWHVVDL